MSYKEIGWPFVSASYASSVSPIMINLNPDNLENGDSLFLFCSIFSSGTDPDGWELLTSSTGALRVYKKTWTDGDPLSVSVVTGSSAVTQACVVVFRTKDVASMAPVLISHLDQTEVDIPQYTGHATKPTVVVFALYSDFAYTSALSYVTEIAGPWPTRCMALPRALNDKQLSVVVFPLGPGEQLPAGLQMRAPPQSGGPNCHSVTFGIPITA